MVQVNFLQWLIFLGFVNSYCQVSMNMDLFKISSLYTVNFFVSSNTIPTKNYIKTGKIVNMSCEIHYNFNDSTKFKILTGIDSLHNADNELIGNCYDSNNLYDSYLLFHHRDNTKTKVVFVCKDYTKGLITVGNSTFYVHLKSNVASILNDIATQLRSVMCPCKDILPKKK